MLDNERQQLVLDNLKLVYYIANKLGYRNDEDAIQYGFLGLCKAADAFDPGRGVKFSTFAYSYISHWLAGTYSDIKMREQINNGNFVDFEDLSYIISSEENHYEELSEVLSSAKPELQEIFILMLEGYSRKEISSKCKVSQPTISRWISQFKEEINNGRNQKH